MFLLPTSSAVNMSKSAIERGVRTQSWESLNVYNLTQHSRGNCL